MRCRLYAIQIFNSQFTNLMSMYMQLYIPNHVNEQYEGNINCEMTSAMTVSSSAFSSMISYHCIMHSVHIVHRSTDEIEYVVFVEAIKVNIVCVTIFKHKECHELPYCKISLLLFMRTKETVAKKVLGCYEISQT